MFFVACILTAVLARKILQVGKVIARSFFGYLESIGKHSIPRQSIPAGLLTATLLSLVSVVLFCLFFHIVVGHDWPST